MKKKAIIIFTGITCLLIFMSARKGTLPGCDSPLVGGHTGAPGETACSGCHPGTLNSGAATFTFDLGTTTYSPSQTYTGTVRISQPGMLKFGFAGLALRNSNNTTIGSFSLIETVRTRTYADGSRNYVSHTPCGADSTNANSWLFKWTAPATNVGNITLYIGFLAANHSHSTAGDFSYTSNILLTPQTISYVKELSNNNNFSITTNPSESYLNVSYKRFDEETPVTIQIYDLQGKKIHASKITEHDNKITTQNWAKGIYSITLTQNEQSFHKKFIIE